MTRLFSYRYRNPVATALGSDHCSLFTISYSLSYVPVSQLVIYSSISGVRTSMFTPIAWSLRLAIS